VRPTIHDPLVDQGSGERATVLIVRAWTEIGPPRTLKVRMVTAATIGSPPIVVGAATDIEQACAQLRAWLADVASGVEPAGWRRS
jgi:hypothetical protein